MPYTRTHKGLYLTSLNEEQHGRTCNYWWTVTEQVLMPHTAFRTLHALQTWFARVGMKLTAPLPAQGVHGSQFLRGEYRTCMYMELTREQFEGLQGEQFRALSNGQYTLGIASRDADGIVTLHTMNPNCKDRPLFNYWESEGVTDTGAAVSCKACSAAVHPLHYQCPNCATIKPAERF